MGFFCTSGRVLSFVNFVFSREFLLRLQTEALRADDEGGDAGRAVWDGLGHSRAAASQGQAAGQAGRKEQQPNS